MRVALAQLLSGVDPAANLVQVQALVASASEAGADLVVFPEATMRCFGRSTVGNTLADVAETLDGPWATQVRALADTHKIVVVAGMFTPAADGRVHNTLLAAGPDVEAHYDKIHLFDAFGYAESDTVAPGAEPVLIDVAGVRVGLSTCYDVRFPGLYTILADRGAQVVCVCASWGAGPGKVEQWELLVRARALDATTFVAAVGQADPSVAGDPRSATAPTGVGHSAFVSPLGVVLSSLGVTPGLLVADLDVAEVAAARRLVPVLANRQF